MAKVAYIRVSSVDQNLERQLADVDLDFKKVFKEKASAKDRNRPKLESLLEYVREGDEVHVHSIDRLARNLKDLQEIIEDLITKDVSIHFYTEGLSFTGVSNPMNDLMLQMMGAFAQFERALIRERQREGIAAAKAAGKQIGRKPKLNEDQKNNLRKDSKEGMTPTQLAKKYGISRPSVYDMLKKGEPRKR